MRLAIVGASGFVGHATAEAAVAQGHDVTPISAPRLESRAVTAEEISQEASTRAAGSTLDDLIDRLFDHDAVVNCAGLAAPDAPPSASLTGANALLPALLAGVAQRAKIPRFIHVSSAAVQGRRPVLDESMSFDLRSPYAISKALGEEAVLNLSSPDVSVQVYRATSVQGTTRSITQSLLQLAHAPWTPISGHGDQPLPLSLIENTAAAILHCAGTTTRGVALHPWEGMTVRRFFSIVNPDGRLVPLPAAALTAGTELLWQLSRRSGRIAALAKRVDLIVNGQRSESAGALDSLSLPLGDDGYAELGATWRQSTTGGNP